MNHTDCSPNYYPSCNPRLLVHVLQKPSTRITCITKTLDSVLHVLQKPLTRIPCITKTLDSVLHVLQKPSTPYYMYYKNP